MKTFAIFTASLLGAAKGYSESSGSSTSNINSTQSMVSSYTPPQFIENYNYSFCPSNTTAINIPPAFVYYPYSSRQVWAIIGDFYNISWINPAIKTQGEGPDNVVGAIRHQQGDPLAQEEILSAYYNGEAPDNQGFFGQMSNYAPNTVEYAPGWTIEKIRPVLTLVPTCGRKGAQLGFYLTYCMGTNATALKPGFDEAAESKDLANVAYNGSANALKNVWQILDGKNQIAFNSTGSCTAISNYQN